MRRDPALTGLSHQHHHALFHAQRLRRVTAENLADTLEAFAGFWRTEGLPHFAQEEQVLLPAFAAWGDARHALVARALTDHVELRQRAERLLAVPEEGETRGAVAAAQELGERLATHVRMEERELFPLIEQTLPAGELEHLARRLRDDAE